MAVYTKINKKDLSFINELNKLPNQIKQKWIKEIADTDTIIDKNSTYVQSISVRIFDKIISLFNITSNL